MSYRAVRVASLLAGMTPPRDSVIEAVALDGFIAQLPPNLVLDTDNSKAVAWLAIEFQTTPGPQFRERTPARAILHSLDRGGRRQHSKRAMAVSSCKAGQSTFACVALACARGQFCAATDRPGPRWRSAVRGTVPPLSQAEMAPVLQTSGPDLNLPQNPTEYLTSEGLHDLIPTPEPCVHGPQGHASFSARPSE